MLNRLFTTALRSSVRTATIERYSYRFEKFKSDPISFYKMLEGRLEKMNFQYSSDSQKKVELESLHDSIKLAQNNLLSKSRRNLKSDINAVYANLRDLQTGTENQDLTDLLLMVENLRSDIIAPTLRIEVDTKDYVSLQKRNISTCAQQISNEIAVNKTSNDLYLSTELLNSFGGVFFLKRLTDMAKANGASYECITCLRSIRRDLEDFSILINAKTSIKVKDFSVFIDEILEAQNHLEKTGYIAGQVYKSFSVRVKDLKCQLDSQISSGSTGR